MAVRIPVSPAPNTEGLFSVNSPFTIASNVIYKLEAIRTFPELARRDIDVYTSYYEPVGLTRADYLDDADVGAAILILKSSDGEIVYIPNTYLASYPGQSSVSYSRNVLVFDLAVVPSTIDVSIVKADIVDLIKRYIGVETVAELTTLAYEGAVSDEEHVRMEALRKQTIRQAIPLDEQVKTLTETNQKLQDLNDKMIEILKAHGLAN